MKQFSDFFMYLFQDLKIDVSQLLWAIGLLLLTPWAQLGSIFLKALSLTGCSPAFIGVDPRVPEIYPNETSPLF